MRKEYLSARFEAEEFEKIKQCFVLYQSALAIVLTQISNISAHYDSYEETNPIEHIKTRIKSPESIAGKLKKKNLPITAQAANDELYDIAGIRIISSYAKNIYEIVNIIRKNNAFRVVEEKDFIKNPKDSGYRSYHMIVEVDLGNLFNNKIVKVEIQLRTQAMDFWATLEHKASYKYQGKMPEIISNELKTIAEQTHELDDRMYLIQKTLERINGDNNV